MTKFLDRSVAEFLATNDVSVTKFLEQSSAKDASVAQYLNGVSNLPQHLGFAPDKARFMGHASPYEHAYNPAHDREYDPAYRHYHGPRGHSVPSHPSLGW